MNGTKHWSLSFALQISIQLNILPMKFNLVKKVTLPLQHTLQAKELFPMVNKPMDEVHHQNSVAYRAKLIEKVSSHAWHYL